MSNFVNVRIIRINDDLISKFVLVGLCLTVIGAGILLIGTFWGDPTIYLVYARNIAQGDFFSFNPGEFSSGSTSPLWAMILSISFLSKAVNCM